MGTFLHCWWECKLIHPLWKTVISSVASCVDSLRPHGEQYGDSLKKKKNETKKLGIELPYDPAISLLGILPEKTITERDTYTPTFVATLFTIARTWMQPRCPLTDEWIQRLWYMYKMECYLALKKNTFELALVRWMNLETIVQSEVS